MSIEKLAKYENQIVKIILKRNKEVPYIHGTFIAYLKYDSAVKGFILNHPYSVKDKTVNYGEAGFDPKDIRKIEGANETDMLTWLINYHRFHVQIVKIKGFDTAEIKNLVIDLIIK